MGRVTRGVGGGGEALCPDLWVIDWCPTGQHPKSRSNQARPLPRRVDNKMELYRFAPAQIYNIDNNGNFPHQDLFWKKQAVVKSERGGRGNLYSTFFFLSGLVCTVHSFFSLD